ncbi:MAG TPA: Clp protease N-terminal domain-containing protein [Pseudonocardiaceae bacterium]|nr:Clp protease N-terminal domain-containing protein [Pseudonocardiaceae bacterium]
MFERFSERARRAVVLAQDEARRLGHQDIRAEDLLLSVIHESMSVAAMTLESLGIDLETVRQRVEETTSRREEVISEHIPFASQTKDVLARAMRVSGTLGHNYIGTEHLLLGLIDDIESVATQVLTELGVTLEGTRAQVLRLLDDHQRGHQSGS